MLRFTLPLLLLFALPAFSFQLPEEQFIDSTDENAYGIGDSVARMTHAGKYVEVTHADGFEEDGLINFPVVAGDTVKTRLNSYVELEFIDRSLMQIDEHTRVEFQAIHEVYDNESLTVVNLHQGSIFLHVADLDENYRARTIRLDSPDGSVYLEVPGIYRLDRLAGRTTIKTFRGLAEISGENHSELVRAGQTSSIHSFYTPSRPRSFNSFYTDNFEDWAYSRGVSDRGYQNNSYVDRSIAHYSRDLGNHGDWRYNNDLNTHVWVPRVNASWRPYNNGYWTRRLGAVTWVSYDSFGWVTHHYGRWGWRLGWGWYWIPSRYYAPAWVAWSSYDSYVGWCPLGYWNRPYYYGRGGVNVTIVNNHNHYWNYVRHRNVINTRNWQPERRAIPRDARRVISTRPLYVDRTDVRNTENITRVIRNPALNRERAEHSRGYRGTVVRGESNNKERVRISNRNSGTRAVSRHAETLNRTAVRSRTNTSRSVDVDRNPSSDRAPQRTRTIERDNDRGRSVDRGTTQQGTTRGVERGTGTSRSVNRNDSNSSGTRSVNRNDNNSSGTRSVNRNDNNSSGTRSVNRNDNNSSGTRSVNRNDNNSSGSRSVNRNDDNRSSSRSVNRGSSSNTGTRSINRGNSNSSSSRSVNRSNSSSSNTRSVNRGNSSNSNSRAVKRGSSSNSKSSATRGSSGNQSQTPVRQRDN